MSLSLTDVFPTQQVKAYNFDFEASYKFLDGANLFKIPAGLYSKSFATTPPALPPCLLFDPCLVFDPCALFGLCLCFYLVLSCFVLSCLCLALSCIVLSWSCLCLVFVSLSCLCLVFVFLVPTKPNPQLNLVFFCLVLTPNHSPSTIPSTQS
jgi:hypothetical protein